MKLDNVNKNDCKDYFCKNNMRLQHTRQILIFYYFNPHYINLRFMAEQAPQVPAPAATKPEGEKRGFAKGGDKKGGKRPDRKKD